MCTVLTGLSLWGCGKAWEDMAQGRAAPSEAPPQLTVPPPLVLSALAALAALDPLCLLKHLRSRSAGFWPSCPQPSGIGAQIPCPRMSPLPVSVLAP